MLLIKGKTHDILIKGDSIVDIVECAQGYLGVENIVPTARVRFRAHTDGATPSVVALDEIKNYNPCPLLTTF